MFAQEGGPVDPAPTQFSSIGLLEPTGVLQARPSAASSIDGLSTSAQTAPPPRGSGITIDIAGTTLSLYLHYRFDQLIPRIAMREALFEAEVSLRSHLGRYKDIRYPANEWTFIKEGLNCIIYVERTTLFRPVGVPQQLTYDLLSNIVEGLYDVLFNRGLFCGAEFDIFESHLGPVARGTVTPWSSLSGNLTSSNPGETT
ncbi:hypothetical protein ACLMJK_001706 [Lecanora helva]